MKYINKEVEFNDISHRLRVMALMTTFLHQLREKGKNNNIIAHILNTNQVSHIKSRNL